MNLSRRTLLQNVATLAATPSMSRWAWADEHRPTPLKITGLTVTPIALPDPPLLAAHGCHGPYFLRNIVELHTDAGIVGIGETHGGETVTKALQQAAEVIRGKNAFAIRSFAAEIMALSHSAFAAIEVACLDACGRATQRRVCELLGGPIAEQIEFAAYLFYRFAADDPRVLADKRIVDARGSGVKALDDFGEVRTPEAMVALAEQFHRRWGFRVLKLKAGVLAPDAEVETIRLLHEHFKGQFKLRIDPNGHWTVATAKRLGEKLKPYNLEYYEDPVRGQQAMGEVRDSVGLKMSTNMCVTRFAHIPSAIKQPCVDVVLADHHYWGGMTGCQELGRIAQTVGWELSQHSNNHAGISMAAMTHLAAVIPQLTLASDTHYPWLPEEYDIIEGVKIPIVDGKIAVPRGVGLGVTLDRDRLARAAEVYRRCGMRQRDDRGTMKMIEPAFDTETLR